MFRYSIFLFITIGYLLLLGTTSIAKTHKITSLDAAANDYFGWSVAADGDTIVVGSYLDDDAGGGSGSAYIFQYNSPPGSYTQVAKLTASDAAGSDQFGISVAINNDTVVVGAFMDDGHGSAYVFEKPSGGWVNMNERAKLTASDAATSDSFGYSVAVDGDTIVVGAYGDNSVSGSAYVYAKPLSGWSNMNETAKLTASDAAAMDEFGRSVAVSDDVIAVGSFRDDDGGTNTGSAYLFEKPVSGWANMNETAKLTASDAAMGDLFGSSVAISGDTLVVGAQNGDYLNFNSGSAYVFEMPAGGWVTMYETAELTATDGASGHHFGQSVSISGDSIVVGAYVDDHSGVYSGSAYLFEKPAGGWNANINEKSKITAYDAAANDYFGYCVSISGDVIIVGSYRDDDNYTDSGSAYIYVADADNDGLRDSIENVHSCLDPNDDDTDNDGVIDGLEDANHNGIMDTGETNPCDDDSDSDGLLDGEEVNTYFTNPLSPDTDNDGLSDNDEINTWITDPLNEDSDSDKIPDGWEVQYGLNPLVNDANEDKDNDGADNLREYRANTDPTDPDSKPKTGMPWLPLLMSDE